MKKLIRFYDNDGFTIIELLMAIIILGVVMAAITTMIVQSFNVFDSSTRRMSAGQLTELALSEVGGYLRAVRGPRNISDYNLYIDPDTGEIDPEIDKEYDFSGFYNDEQVNIKIEYISDSNRLVLAVDGDVERNMLNNVTGFYIDIDEEDDELTGNFDIYIKAEDGEGNIAEKRLNIKSRNI